MRHSCRYCDWWYQSAVIRKSIEEDKKNPKKNKNKEQKVTKRCLVTRKKINSASPHCKWFSPSTIHCDEHSQRIKIINCLDRRRNEKLFPTWEKCKNCRQFDIDIKEIAETYWLGGKIINSKTDNKKQGYEQFRSSPTSKKKRKILRRGQEPKKKRVIKRRKKSYERLYEKSTRKTIKRRKAFAEPTRKIKRRK